MTISATKAKDFFTVAKERASVRLYDKNFKMSKDDIEELLELTMHAPSAWNLQHWHFMVFHGDDVQQKLLPIAYNQQQVVDASAVIAVLGDLEANKNFDLVIDMDIQAGMATNEVKETLGRQIAGAYENKQYARDAAFSNASLAAMQLMLAAQAKGYSTVAMGGFNSEAFMKEFSVSSRYVPVMLIAVGKAAAPARPTQRLDINQLTTWV
ncbi:nitroreductase family protein [Fictibacillus sp. Mic-4]|uniref:nitroreductase family protein n=1 Tax=Fictibacillus TaxID=1329200 RepID=UPI000419A03D|nr:nitroreductase family protein [Fictibacillus gelatini]